MPIRTLIVDEDAVSSGQVRRLLAADPELTIVSVCTSGEQTLKAMSGEPQLVFVNPRMRDLNCFELLRSQCRVVLPVTIAIAPDAVHAMEAFDADVFAYLIKPISADRLLAVVARAKAYIKSQSVIEGGKSASFGSSGLSADSDRLIIRSQGKFVFLSNKEIEWIQADRNYVHIHTGDSRYIYRQTMSSLERKLDPCKFVRIHNSTIVNVDKIRELRPWPTGEYIVLMRNGKELTLSRGYRVRLRGLTGELREPSPGSSASSRIDSHPHGNQLLSIALLH